MPGGTAGPDGGVPGRRGVIAGGVIVLVLVAFGVFILPFAFTTPPPIITRFVATHAFSPGNPGARHVARVSIRLSEPSDVTITIKDSSGRIVARLADEAPVRARTFSVPWLGRDLGGARVPDGEYTIDLDARAGEKRFSKSRRVVVDTTAPRPVTTVESTPAGCVATASAPGEAAAITFTAVGTGTGTPPREIGPRGSAKWRWNGRAGDGNRLGAGLKAIRITAVDERGNASVRSRTCWIANLVATATPRAPSSGDEVGVTVPGGPDANVTLSLRARLGDLGGFAGRPVVGGSIGPALSGPAGTTRVTIPAGTSPRDVWLLASTGSGRTALIGFGDAP